MSEGHIRRGTLFALLVLAWSHVGGAHTDGTLGPQRSFSGHFTVPANVGQQRGGNLFHSFSDFGLAAGESATFAGPTSVRNVIVRVTGGAASTIDGTLGCSIPNADLYLLNPAGIAFGPGASLDLKGSFAVSTADVLTLGKAGAYPTRPAGTPALSTAAPSAFGFLAPRPVAVSVTNASLKLREGAAFTVVAPSLTMSAGQVVAPAGRVTVVTPASAGTVRLDGSHPDAQPVASGVSTFGPLTLDHGSLLDVSGAGGGRVTFHAGDVTLTGSNVLARTDGPRDGRGASIQAAAFTLLAGSRVSVAANTGTGGGGPLDLSVGRLSMDGVGAAAGALTGLFGGANATSKGAGAPFDIAADDVAMAGGSTIAPGTAGPGRGGDLAIAVAHAITLTTGAHVSNGTSGSGDGGSTTIRAGTLTLDNRGNDAGGPVTGISVRATAGSTGRGGDLTIRADAVDVLAGAEVSATTVGRGRGGDVRVTARRLTLDDRGDPDPTANTTDVVVDTDSAVASGRGGDLTVRADVVRLAAGGQLSTSTSGPAAAGALRLYARRVVVDDRGDPAPDVQAAGVFAVNGGGGGDAGAVHIEADRLTLVAGGQIVADTSGAGRGGDVAIDAGRVTLDGRGAVAGTSTTVSADTLGTARGAGAGGDVTIRAKRLEVLAGAVVSTSTEGRGRGGDLTVAARSVRLDDRFDPASGQSRGLTAESSSSGDAGDLTVRAGTLSVLAGAEVSTEASGGGRGGGLRVTAGTMTVDGRGNPWPANFTAVSAATAGGSAGAGGDLTVRARTLAVRAGGRLATNTSGTGSGGALRITAEAVTIDGRGSARPSDFTGIEAQSVRGASGDAGDLALRAGTLRVVAGGAVSASTFSTGRAGDVTVRAGSLTVDGRGTEDAGASTGLFDDAGKGSAAPGGRLTVRADTIHVLAGGEVVASTFGRGRGGDLTIDAGALAIDGRGAPDGSAFSGVAAQANPGAAGDAGNVTIRAGAMRVTAGGAVSADTFAAGRGGDLTVSADALTLDGRGADPAGMYTGLSASANRGATGRAGDLTVRATAMRVVAGAQVSADTSGPGRGGDVRVTAQRLTVDGRGTATPDGFTGISAASLDAGGTGRGGDVAVRADVIDVLAGGELSATTSGKGRGGDLRVTADDLVVDDRGNPAPGGLTGLVTSATEGSAGAAGDLSVRARTIDVRAGGDLSASTSGRGRGGDVTIAARSLTVDDAGNPVPGSFTGVAAGASASARGDAGNVAVDVGDLSVKSGGRISVRSDGRGAAGRLRVTAGTVLLDDRGNREPSQPGGLFATLGGGARAASAAGSVAVRASGTLAIVGGATVTTSAPASAGGSISLSAQRQLLLDAGAVSSTAGASGGSVALSSPIAVVLRNGSAVTTRSTGGNGGNIAIDPLVLKLGARSTLNANGGVNGGNVTIRATATPGLRLGGPDANVTATGATGLAGSVATGPATTDVTNAIPRLPASLFSAAAALQPRCGEGASFNSFVFTGMGGLSLDPQAWQWGDEGARPEAVNP